MQIDIIGLGYVGLITGLCLSEKGHIVNCYDLIKEKVDKTNKKETLFYEPGLKKILNKNIRNNKFKALLLEKNTKFTSRILIIAVGTPSKNKKIDLSQIKKICIFIAKSMKKNNNFISIVLKSTIPPSITDTYIKNIIEKYSDKKFSKGEFGLGMNPEFLREGNAISDFMNADRIVIGSEDTKTKSILKKIYSSWKCDKIFVNTRTAEMIKYANNSLLALQISGVNEIANVCNSIGLIDVNQVIHGVKTDKRWNPIVNKKRLNPEILHYLNPGPGFGGSCFPKDVETFVNIANKEKISSKLFKEVLNVNKNQPLQVIKLLKSKVKKLDNKKIMILGLSFKPGTDDIRESISIKIIKKLLAFNKNIKILAHDPTSVNNVKKLFGNQKNIYFIKNWEKDIFLANIIMISTNWPIYKKLKTLKIKSKLSKKLILDLRNMFSKDDFKNLSYFSFNQIRK